MLSPEAAERAIDAWRLEARARIQASTDPDEIRAVAEEARTRLGQSDLPVGARATLHMVVSGAYGRLAKLDIDRSGNGRRAFDAATEAVRLAPTKTLVAENYGRTLLSFTELNWAFRKVVTLTLDIDLEKEIYKSLEWLAASPDVAIAQVVRGKLARWVGNKDARKAAESALAAIAAKDPDALAAAVNQLEEDRRRARE